MNIQVLLEKNQPSRITGGAYAETDITIHVDETLSIPERAELIIHEVLDAYLNILPHSLVDDLTDKIIDALVEGKVFTEDEGELVECP